MSWNEFPIARILIPIISGILFGIFLNIPISFSLLILILLLIILAILTYQKSYIKNKLIKLTYFLFWFSTLFFSAYVLTILKTEKFKLHYFDKYENIDGFVLKIDDDVILGAKNVKLNCQVLSVKKGNEYLPATGNFMVYVKDSANSLGLKYGDVLFSTAQPKLVNAPQNPEEFNYKRYLSFHGIYHQMLVQKNQLILIEKQYGFSLKKLAIAFKNWIFEVLNEHDINENDLGVSMALLIGEKQFLDDEIVNAYSHTGAMHVLAVSGLHVGIIFLVLNSLLKFLEKNQKLKMLKAILLIIALWIYAFATGFSPSVIRAATMFSFVQISFGFNFKSNIYNTIAASALVMALANPYFVTEVGAQLSFLAVFGIIYFHKPIYNLIVTKNKVVDWIWNISCVSIAAQIATFPLGLLYFHQFPVYFLLSNIFVIPISTGVMYSGFSFLIFYKIPILGDLLNFIFYISVKLLNYLVLLFDKMPHSLIEGVNISVTETYLIYILIVSISAFFIHKIKWTLLLSLALVLVLSFYDLYLNLKTAQQNVVNVYATNQFSNFDFVKGNQQFLLSDSAFLNNENKWTFHMKNYWNTLQIEHSDKVETEKFKRMSNIHDYYFETPSYAVFWLNKQSMFMSNMDLPIDILIVSNNVYPKKINFSKNHLPKQIVLDGTNRNWSTESWKNWCDSLNIQFHAVNLSGAFVARF